MTSFSTSLSAGGRAKTDSGAYGGKIEIRRKVMDGIKDPRVFDAFAGNGSMYRSVWKNAEFYTGCDQRYFPDERLAFVADNRRVMRVIDLSQFNIFDLDAYGSPWEQALILAGRRIVQPGERIGLCITEGSGLKIKMGGLSRAHLLLLGMKTAPVGISRNQDIIMDRCVHAFSRRMNCRLVNYWKVRGKKGSAMRYLGLILEGFSDVGEHEADLDILQEDIVANPS